MALNKWPRTHAPKECVVHAIRHSMRDRFRAVECPKKIVVRSVDGRPVMLERAIATVFHWAA